MAKTPGLLPRRAALKMLDAVLRRGETLEQAGGAANSLPAHSDRALARALAGEVLRWLVDIDALIDSATRDVLPADAKARMVLRIMLAGWLRLGTPPHAVVATALPLLAGGPKRLAHGVYATLSRQGASLPDQPTLPTEVAARWGERTLAIATGLALPPPLDLTVRDPTKTGEWAGRLDAVSLMPGHLRLVRGGNVAELPGYEEGAWWVQDLAASLPARLLGEGEGRRVLDLAAAPGGKTMQLAAAGWDVTALDMHPGRMMRLRENLARTRLDAHTVIADALEWEPDAPFDAVLLDAPCTATGTCRRHPDVLHRIALRHIEEMADLQRRLLHRAAGWVKTGGRLVYATCSLEESEGEGVAASCPLATDPISADGLPAEVAVSDDGWLRTDPGMLRDAGGMDGFFIARFAA